MLKAQIAALLIAAMSVYVLRYPSRFGMRLGVSYHPMPFSPLAKVFGWGGIAVATIIFATTLF